MRAPRNLVLYLAPMLAVAALAGAQTPTPLSVDSVVGLEATFAGEEDTGRAVLEITVELAPHGRCAPDSYLLIRIRDGANPPPFNPTDPEASWVYAGESAAWVTFKMHLPVPAYYRGPIYVDALMQEPERFGRVLGPMMLPVKASGIAPYGTVDLNRNCLHLHAEFGSTTVFPPTVQFRVEGAIPGASGLIALSTNRTEIEFDMGGRLLIGPWPIVPLPYVFFANPAGRFWATLELPSDPRLAGMTFYAQAVSDSTDDSLQPWLFSNGIRVTIPEAR